MGFGQEIDVLEMKICTLSGALLLATLMSLINDLAEMSSTMEGVSRDRIRSVAWRSKVTLGGQRLHICTFELVRVVTSDLHRLILK